MVLSWDAIKCVDFYKLEAPKRRARTRNIPNIMPEGIAKDLATESSLACTPEISLTGIKNTC